MLRRVPLPLLFMGGIFVAGVIATMYESSRLNAAPHGWYVLAYRATGIGRSGSVHSPYLVAGPYDSFRACERERPRNTWLNLFECTPSRMDDALAMPKWRW
jgi:hypothetical protein